MSSTQNALVIVESPAKAKTIGSYLGDGFVVESSIGHIRDLPSKAAEIPKAYKAEPWARLGIDVDNDFKPLYVVSSNKRSQIRMLKQRLADADELYLATDGDREGEAIAWHLLEVLNPRVPVKRMVFHEITKSAITAAVRSPRELDRRLVDAQEARRMLDRLYGYEVSPVLWKKVQPQLSAGRVQSVAIRIVVERERERMAFVSAGYWRLTATFAPPDQTSTAKAVAFKARLVRLDGSRVATGRDFTSDGTVADSKLTVLDEPTANTLSSQLLTADFEVRSRRTKPYRRRPAPPFITSTMQQEAARKLSMSSAAAMRTAQSLYEKGHITYMRTDSMSLSGAAIGAARAAVKSRFGEGSLPPNPRIYRGKVKNAQEAHEAIRPAGEKFADPQVLARQLPRDEARLYELIWKRTLASQMTDCLGETVRLIIGGQTTSGTDAEFSASGTVITHLGFRAVYTEGTDAGDKRARDAELRLPPLQEGDGVRSIAIDPTGHATQPPSRYTEASLVRRLEQLGVGRPSTYSSIMATIADRGYVRRKGSALIPTFVAFSVVRLLEQHFPKLVDYTFTAEMEDDLDRIAAGSQEYVPWLSEFYFGGADDPGLKEKVSSRLSEIDARMVNSIPLGVDADGVGVEVRVGRYGPSVQRGTDIASVPETLEPDELTLERALELLAQPSGERLLGTDPESGKDVFAKSGRYGPYVQLGRSGEGGPKPKFVSLLKSMNLETVSLAEALKVLSLPRSVGAHPEDGTAITVQNGRYGPFIRKGKETRSLASEDQLFTVTLQECVELLSKPRPRRAAQPPLRELGADPVTGNALVIKDGRWGPYVTDGKLNASLRKGDTVEDITAQRASELIAERRARGPARKKPARRKAAPKRTAARRGAKAKSAKSTKKAPKKR